MKVRLTVSMCGPTVHYVAGDVAEFDDATAQRLIDSNQAEPVADVQRKKPHKVEAAAVDTGAEKRKAK